jgi:ABC-type oligopeptide transport system, periplasmic component
VRFVFKLIFRLCSYAISPALGFEYITNTSTGHVAIAESIQADLSILGIEVTIKQEDWNVFLADRKSGNYSGMCREGWLADYNDPINMLEIFTSNSGNNDMQLGK